MTSRTSTELTVRGGVPTSQKVRYIAPDLARGLALLGIALANVPTAWAMARNADYASYFGGVQAPGSFMEDLLVVVHAMFIHVRGMAMFTTLLGFGIGLITLSLWRRGYPPSRARGVMWRRYGLLGLLGVAHLILLFFGDILLQYAVTALVVIAMITLRDRTLMIIAWVILTLAMIIGIVGAVSVFVFPDGMMDLSTAADVLPGNAENYGAYVVDNAWMFLFILAGLPVTTILMLPLMLIGFVWARRGVLTDIDAHRRMLITWVIVGALVVVGVGLPWGLSAIGVLPMQWEAAFMQLNTGFGLLTGPGIVALVALLFRGTYDSLNPVLRPFVALGRRSLSGYVLQSVVLVILTQPFALGWGADSGIVVLLGIGALAWAVTLVWAYVWELLSWPGPLELAHRTASYGRAGLPEKYVDKAQ